MKREFTGKHSAAIIVSGFAIIIAVNLFMATLAVRGFGGVIVENSYVASQEFNDWLDAAEEQKALQRILNNPLKMNSIRASVHLSPPTNLEHC